MVCGVLLDVFVRVVCGTWCSFGGGGGGVWCSFGGGGGGDGGGSE